MKAAAARVGLGVLGAVATVFNALGADSIAHGSKGWGFWLGDLTEFVVALWAMALTVISIRTFTRSAVS